MLVLASVYASTRRRGGWRGSVLPNVALRSVRVSSLLVLLRHHGNGGCKLGFRGTGEGRAADGQRSTNLHDIRRATRRLEIRFAPPPHSIPTLLAFTPNCSPACLAHPPESLHLHKYCLLTITFCSVQAHFCYLATCVFVCADVSVGVGAFVCVQNTTAGQDSDHSQRYTPP